MGGAEGNEEISVQIEQREVYAIVTVEGPIDLATHEVLGDRVPEMLELTDVAVIMDLSAVKFCDSTGLRVFVRLIREVRLRGISLVVTGLQPRVERSLSITGLDQEMHRRPDVDSALDWLEKGMSRGHGQA
ncbi:STAS domain-containing protein [Spirillospora sp. NPDC047279]|uniref:STAS domain-containing protein n=1 Tax=Spirillospora sp. NPDC047279 TaxID=3155478 RepID=UPI0033F51410